MRISKQQKQVQIFYRFLKDNNAYYNFLKYSSRNQRKTIELMIDASLIYQYLNETKQKDYIMLVANWNDTEEGSKFWNQLHDKWVKLVKRLHNEQKYK